jgi:hypothetical protein
VNDNDFDTVVIRLECLSSSVTEKRPTITQTNITPIVQPLTHSSNNHNSSATSTNSTDTFKFHCPFGCKYAYFQKQCGLNIHIGQKHTVKCTFSFIYYLF